MRDMLGYIKSCPGQAECTEQIGRGRQWYRKYELLEKLKASRTIVRFKVPSPDIRRTPWWS